MPNNDTRQRLIDLAAEHDRATARAEELFNKGEREAGKSELTKAQNISNEMADLSALLQEQTRAAAAVIPSAAEARDIAEGRGELLMRGQSVSFNTVEQMRMLRNSVTISTTLTEPVGSGVEVNAPVGYGSSSLIDMVRTEDLTGLSAWEEPYMVSGMDAKGGKVSSNSGTARTSSTDPVFNYAAIKPYEVNVTAFVDKNISRLTPARYYERVLRDATIAYRNKVNSLILNGDGQSTPDMFGIVNAKNKSGTRITKDVTISTIDENFMDELFYGYGSSTAFGTGARLVINKTDLRKLGKVRGTNLERIFKVKYDAANPNTGMLDDSGSVTPYVLVDGLSNSCIYGDPMNYLLGLFGDYTIRIDESVKSIERMVAILGDAFVGGNVVTHNGFVIGKLPSAAG